MHKKYSDCASEDFELLERGREYNRLIGHYETVNKNERYYRGDQWDSGTANDLPKACFVYFTSEQSAYPAVFVNIYLFSRRDFRETGHCHYIAGQGNYEAGTGRHFNISHGNIKALRCAEK